MEKILANKTTGHFQVDAGPKLGNLQVAFMHPV